MDFHQIPGVSIAVIDNFTIAWAKGYGVKDAITKEQLTTNTLFQAASISKPVAAAAALHLVEKGILHLDEDVNNKLFSWKVPENELTRKEKVTLRRILSHKAGLSVESFRGYQQGHPLPTLTQILNGEKPANSAPIWIVIEPGTKDLYSGGGFMVVQQLLIDLMHKPFPEIMEQMVFSPLSMTQSTYEQSPLKASAEDVSSGHKADGHPLPGKHNIYPEMAAAGLWTTPTDLCKFAIAMMHSWTGRTDHFLSKKTVRVMLSNHGEGRGLGFRVQDKGRDFMFRHSGSNAGFKSILIAYPGRGQGVAIMTNADQGTFLINELLHAFAIQYGWKHFRQKKQLSHLSGSYL
jgi:CubicO group peptidase (beta-lactamase class C family)